MEQPKVLDEDPERDEIVQCTRCRNKHLIRERIESDVNKRGFRTLVCPRCNGHNYYKTDDAKDKPIEQVFDPNC